MTSPVGVIIPTYRRKSELLHTLRVILNCRMPPAELFVHVDAGDTESGPAVRAQFPFVTVIEAEHRVGASGGRDRLLREATSPYLVSFDDDSYPIDSDYFDQVARLFEKYPEAGVLAAGAIVHDGETVPERSERAMWVADFVGCGCAYRRNAYLETHGHVPVNFTSYGVEEVELSLQLHDRNWRVLQSDALRVRHATELTHRATVSARAQVIANIALVAYLRYPWRFFPYGALQVANRIKWLLTNGQRSGILRGLVAIPGTIWRYRNARRPVSAETIRFVRLRKRRPEDA